jgi:predicted peptidase
MLATILTMALVAAGDASVDIDPVGLTTPIQIQEMLVVGPVGRGGRRPVHTDAVEARVVAGDLDVPGPGDMLELPDGTQRAWALSRADENGWIIDPALRGGYASVVVNAADDGVVLLEASGHRAVYVNGEPRAGDPYGTGWAVVPVALDQGANNLLFPVGRGRVRAQLSAPKSPAMFNLRDKTVPDLVDSDTSQVVAGIIVVNATQEWRDGLRVWTSGDAVDTTATPVAPIAPLSFRKTPVLISPRDTTGRESIAVQFRLTDTDTDQGDVTLDEASIDLRVRRPDQKRKTTFVSDVDGSVQYYALVPANPAPDSQSPPGLVLTLHGASVEATNQARAYAPKPWCHIVAPTNRRPYGFDWEDWGRLDAIEVLDLTMDDLEVDPSRVYLTGHSMGGHGTWHVGVTFPARFAAIAPSAGWISFWSYAGAARYENKEPIEVILTRATSASDTLSLSRNYLTHGIYVLHGDRDDNVPVEQARTMRRHLADFHPDFSYYERPGAGHWWGNACVDWQPLFDYLEDHTIPPLDEVDHVEFYTADPGVSANSHWASIHSQQQPLQISSVTIDLDRNARRFTGTSNNVERLALDVGHLKSDGPITVELDGTKVEVPASSQDTARIWLVRNTDGWILGAPPSPNDKGPHRAGMFKDVFRNRPLLVYGTQGTAEENAWALAKARYDAETFWYRGNGVLEVTADHDFHPALERDRNVVLYGNADTNGAWAALLGESPVQVQAGSLRVNGESIEDDDLACLLVRPRPGSNVASVGAVSGTGPAGMRLTDRMPYFVSGIAYPDCIVLGPEALERGIDGVRVAGFFGNDWSVENGDFAWRR